MRPRDWLAGEIPRNVFHLVVDELHTYRGTPGTEVAYLLRVFLDRLGLHPDHDQLRIIASSASLSDDAAGREYLHGFFGRDRSRFAVIGGRQRPLSPTARASVAHHASALGRLSGARSTVSGARRRRRRTREPRSARATARRSRPAGARSAARSSARRRADALRAVCRQRRRPRGPQPRQTEDIGARSVPAAPPRRRRPQPQRGSSRRSRPRNCCRRCRCCRCVRTSCSATSRASGPASDPACGRRRRGRTIRPGWLAASVPPRAAVAAPGCLSSSTASPAGRCSSAATAHDTDNNSAWRLTPDFPDLEQVPDRAGAERDLRELRGVLAVARHGRRATPSWTQEERPARVAPRGSLDPADRACSGRGGGQRLPLLRPVAAPRAAAGPARTPSRPSAFPSRCPRCDADWAQRERRVADPRPAHRFPEGRAGACGFPAARNRTGRPGARTESSSSFRTAGRMPPSSRPACGRRTISTPCARRWSLRWGLPARARAAFQLQAQGRR